MPPTLCRPKTRSSEACFVYSFERTMVSPYHFTSECSDVPSNEKVVPCLCMRLQSRLERCRPAAHKAQKVDIGSVRFTIRQASRQATRQAGSRRIQKLPRSAWCSTT